jgi:antitoxin HicB
MLRYPIVLEQDDNDTLLVSFPDLPDAHTFGEDEADALVRGKDALVTALEARIRDREPIPKPSAVGKAKLAVAVPALVELKLELYAAMRAHRVNKSALARSLDVHMPQVDRLLDLRHQSRLDLLEAAFGSLGCEVAVSVHAFETRKSTPASAAAKRPRAASSGKIAPKINRRRGMR